MSSEDASPSSAPENGPSGPGTAYCDLIMKGGITSGVIYPKLISGLASKYRFKNIGGTSAGAIAAAGCAAAEFRRLCGSTAGFETLDGLPGELGHEVGKGKGSVLRHLFQPSRTLSRHFDVLIASLNRPSKVAIVVNALGTLLWRYWAIVAAVALVMLGVVVALIRSIGPIPWGVASATACTASAVWLAVGWFVVWRPARRAATPALWTRVALWWLGGMAALFFWLLLLIHPQPEATAWPAVLLATASWGIALPLALVLALGLCAWKFGASLLNGLSRNFWGICSGLSTRGDSPVAGLTVWLTHYFNEVAGLEPAARPLTVGDLWSGDRALGDDKSEAEDTPSSERKINLEVMTTAVSRQMPYALPFRPGAGAYFFDPEEWARLFPPTVMKWLLEASPPIPADGGARTRDGRPLRRLPCNRHLPVVLLVRMSLSFPVLLSAVPMYAFDHSGKGESKFPKKVWFSDGGIASNMPLHFFDAPLPGHPTFAVNLKDEHPDHPIRPHLDACAPDNGRVYLPDNNSAGLQQYWKEIDENSSLGLFNLLWRMVETMHSWHDEIQLPMPGYRDRVVQIAQMTGEGGLNLDMPGGHIKALSDAGACAAKRLIERFSFAAGEPMSDGWQNHRQIRMRTFIALSERLGRHPSVHEPGWRDLLASGDVAYNADQRQQALHTFDALATIGPAADRESQLALLEKAPRPRPVWRIVPRI